MASSIYYGDELITSSMGGETIKCKTTNKLMERDLLVQFEDISGGNATASDLLLNKTALSGGTLITGTIPFYNGEYTII